jgi:hypothetical protein
MKFIRVASTAAVLLVFGATTPVYAQQGGEKHEEKQSRPQEQHAQQPAPRQPAAQPRQAAPPQRVAQQAPATPPARQQEQRAPQTPRQPERAQQVQQPQQRPQQAAQTQPARQQHVQQGSQPQSEQRLQTRQQPQQQPQRTQQAARSWQQQKGWAQQGGGSQGHTTFAQDRSTNWSSEHRTWSQRGGYGGYYIPQDRFAVSFGSQHFFRLGVLPVMYLGYPQFAYGGFSFLMVDPWPGDWSANWYASDDVYIDYDDGYYLYNRRYPEERLAVTIEL